MSLTPRRALADHPLPVLQGDGLRLRPWQVRDDDDAAFVLAVSQDADSRRFSGGLRRVVGMAGARAWLAERAPRLEWVVEDASSGDRLGRVALHHVDESDAAGEVGYWTAPWARGRGVARRALRTAGTWGHEALGLHRLVLHHSLDNPASCLVALAAGFALEGTAREACDHGAGPADVGARDFHDMHVHARLADDPWDPLPLPPAPMTPVEVVAGALQLTAWQDADVPAVLRAMADPQIARWNGFGETGEAAAGAWLARGRRWGEHAAWAVRDATTGEVLGSVSLHHLSPEHARGELGYWVLPEARGRGVATAAVLAATRYGFQALGLERVELFHGVDNVGSCQVARRAGFALEGTSRRSYRYGDGTLHDEHLHARLRDDPDVG